LHFVQKLLSAFPFPLRTVAVGIPLGACIHLN
jgi:hypothetical protein